MNEETVIMVIVMPTMFVIMGWAFKILLNFIQQRQLTKLHYALQDKLLEKLGNSPEALEYLPEDTDNSSGGITGSPFLLGSYDTFSLEDVLRTRFGITDGKGVLIVKATKPISASARVWTAGPQGGTAGNGVRTVHGSSMSAGETVLPGVRMREGFRSNVGVVTGNAWTTIEFRLRDADGILLAKEFVEVPPRTLTQLSLTNLFGNNVQKPDPVGSLAVVGGNEFIAYLTVIDGSSQDPVFVMPQ